MKTPLFALVLAAACGGAAPSQDDSSQDDVTVPPIEVVSAGVYRGLKPSAATLAQLKALGVKTILDLQNESGDVAAERPAVTRLGMKFVSEPMSGFWTPDDTQVNRIEGIMADTTQRPIFVHCLHGEDRTGVIVALFRWEQQGWTAKAAYKEMIAKGFHKALFLLNHYYEEKTGFDD